MTEFRQYFDSKVFYTAVGVTTLGILRKKPTITAIGCIAMITTPMISEVGDDMLDFGFNILRSTEEGVRGVPYYLFARYIEYPLAKKGIGAGVRAFLGWKAKRAAQDTIDDGGMYRRAITDGGERGRGTQQGIGSPRTPERGRTRGIQDGQGAEVLDEPTADQEAVIDVRNKQITNEFLSIIGRINKPELAEIVQGLAEIPGSKSFTKNLLERTMIPIITKMTGLVKFIEAVNEFKNTRMEQGLSLTREGEAVRDFILQEIKTPATPRVILKLVAERTGPVPFPDIDLTSVENYVPEFDL